MEVTNTMDVSVWLRKHLEEADPDLLRTMLQTFAEALMGGRGQRSQRGLRRGHARTGQLEKRVPEPALGHKSRHHRPRHPQAAQR